MLMKKKIKVFIGLREIAGYFGYLKGGFEEIGIDAAFLNLGGNGFNYPGGKNPNWIEVLNFIGREVGARFSRTFLLRFIWLTIFQNIFSLIAFFVAIFNYNIFIFGANSTFLYFLELPILKLLNKKIIYVFLGSDSRPLYLNGAVFNGNQNPKLLIRLTWIQKNIIKIIEKYATIIINHPPQAIFHEKPFISSILIGLPFRKEDSSVEIRNKRTGYKGLKIIHAPSKKGSKGSDKFKEIITRLKEKYDLHYIEVSGIPNSEVLDIISDADIALDQLYSDTPMAVFALECAFHKVPVVVGSNYANSIRKDYKNYELPPSMFVLPENIEKAIEKLIVDEDYRVQLGKDAYDFVSHNCSPSIVAEKYLKLIRGKFPEEWLYDPYNISYIFGCGLSKEQVKENVKLFIKYGGTKSLFLKDKPHLEKKLLRMIEE